MSAFLKEAGAEARIQEFPDGTHTAQDAADAVGCELAQIVKSLVFVCGGRPVVALVPGDRRGDPEKVARAVDASEARVAKAREVEDATGFAPGAVPPFPLPDVEVVLMDLRVLPAPARVGGRRIRESRARNGSGRARATLAGAPNRRFG